MTSEVGKWKFIKNKKLPHTQGYNQQREDTIEMERNF